MRHFSRQMTQMCATGVVVSIWFVWNRQTTHWNLIYSMLIYAAYSSKWLSCLLPQKTDWIRNTKNMKINITCTAFRNLLYFGRKRKVVRTSLVFPKSIVAVDGVSFVVLGQLGQSGLNYTIGNDLCNSCNCLVWLATTTTITAVFIFWIQLGKVPPPTPPPASPPSPPSKVCGYELKWEKLQFRPPNRNRLPKCKQRG